MAGVEKILSQDPFRAPTREPKRSPKPLFHFTSREAGDELKEDRETFETQYQATADALRSGRMLPSAASLFPAGCYPPALPFTGSAAPPRPLPPPTRPLRTAKREVVKRGPIPVIRPPVRIWGIEPQEIEPQARGQPL